MGDVIEFDFRKKRQEDKLREKGLLGLEPLPQKKRESKMPKFEDMSEEDKRHYVEGLKYVVETQRFRITELQRTMCWGFTRTINHIDRWHELGYIAQVIGTEYMALLSVDEFDNLFPE